MRVRASALTNDGLRANARATPARGDSGDAVALADAVAANAAAAAGDGCTSTIAVRLGDMRSTGAGWNRM
jgi:hypothetical protein